MVYDSCIHGSWRRMRDRANERHGLARDIGENIWINRYVNERREWLANHTNTLLHRTVYRMDAFRQLINEAKWGLDLPLRMRGILIDEDILLGTEPIRASAHDEDERTLRLQSPHMQGNDVQAVQQALVDAGFAVSVDGVFGPRTEEAVKQFQQQRGLTVDGIVGPATRSALAL